MAKKKTTKKKVTNKVAKKATAKKTAKKTTKKKIAKKATKKPAVKKAAAKKTAGKTTDPHEAFFNELAQDMSRSRRSVTPGAMMSHPGIRYKNKVFAFYYDDRMVFRLGKEFDPASAGIRDFSYLSPFKNKPPMKAWFVIPAKDRKKWRGLAEIALEKMTAEIG